MLHADPILRLRNKEPCFVIGANIKLDVRLHKVPGALLLILVLGIQTTATLLAVALP